MKLAMPVFLVHKTVNCSLSCSRLPGYYSHPNDTDGVHELKSHTRSKVEVMDIANAVDGYLDAVMLLQKQLQVNILEAVRAMARVAEGAEPSCRHRYKTMASPSYYSQTGC